MAPASTTHHPPQQPVHQEHLVAADVVGPQAENQQLRASLGHSEVARAPPLDELRIEAVLSDTIDRAQAEVAEQAQREATLTCALMDAHQVVPNTE